MKNPFRKITFLWRQLAAWGSVWSNRTPAVSAALLIAVVALLATYGFFHSAPPDTIVITSGPDGSMFQRNAEKYRKILERNGVRLKILPSKGSLENVARLNDGSSRVDIGFVQGGVSGEADVKRLVSLGSTFYEPLMIFYRSEVPLELLSAFSGKRLVIGPEGTGTRQLALALLKPNGIEPGGATALLDVAPNVGAAKLMVGEVDAVFLMGDSADSSIIRWLLREPGIRLFSFSQADAYTRRFQYLNKLVLPKGSIDFGRNLPADDVSLVGPTVELVAREGLHPALSDLLLETAREVHGRATLLQRRGEFPAPLEHEFRISEDANRYYTSGKTFLYRNLPFWLATLADRMLGVILPVIVLLVPGLRIIPSVYSWRVRSRILRWYGTLLALEREVLEGVTEDARSEFLQRLDHLEDAVNRLKVPIYFADQFYVLREHINFVRDRVKRGEKISGRSRSEIPAPTPS